MWESKLVVSNCMKYIYTQFTQCTVYRVQCTVCRVQFTVYSVQSTVQCSRGSHQLSCHYSSVHYSVLWSSPKSASLPSTIQWPNGTKTVRRPRKGEVGDPCLWPLHWVIHYTELIRGIASICNNLSLTALN